jgi:hypothetical protein
MPEPTAGQPVGRLDDIVGPLACPRSQDGGSWGPSGLHFSRRATQLPLELTEEVSVRTPFTKRLSMHALSATKSALVLRMTLRFAFAFLLGTAACGSAEGPYENYDSGVNRYPHLGPRRQMTCGTGLPSINVEDRMRAVATCPGDGKQTAQLIVICEAGPVLQAETNGEEILVVCPEDIAPGRQ